MRTRQLDKYSSAIMVISMFFCCQFNFNDLCQAAPTKSTDGSNGEPKKVILKEKNIIDPKKANASKELAAQNKALKNKFSLTEGKDWRVISDQAAAVSKTLSASQREEIYSSLIPRARHDAPNSLEFGLLLTRYATSLLDQQKYELAASNYEEAAHIIRQTSDTERKRRVFAQTLGAEGCTLANLKKFDKAEICLRQAIAYTIAFPNIKQKFGLKKCYFLLRICLEKQNKQDEANLIADLLTNS